MNLFARSGGAVLAMLAISAAPALAQYDRKPQTPTAGSSATLTARLVDQQKKAMQQAATVEVSVTGIQLVDPATARETPASGQGHLHYQVDNGPVIATTSTKLSFHQLSPGAHTITVMLADNAHNPLGPQQRLNVNVSAQTTRGPGQQPQTPPSHTTAQTEPARPPTQTETAQPTMQTQPAQPTTQTQPAQPTTQTQPAQPTTQTQPAQPGTRAESRPTTQGAATTLVGCVYRERDVPGRTPNVAERAGVLEDYILATVSGQQATTPSPGSTPGATGTSGATGSMYKLEFVDDDRLRALVGKRVEVTGRIDAESGDRPAGTAGTPQQDRSVGPDQVELAEFEITSIREIGGTCPASPGRR